MHIDSERMRKLIKKNVREVEPTAQVWLYGSRVRGKAREDSDWDVLVLSAKKAFLSKRKSVLWIIYVI